MVHGSAAGGPGGPGGAPLCLRRGCRGRQSGPGLRHRQRHRRSGERRSRRPAGRHHHRRKPGGTERKPPGDEDGHQRPDFCRHGRGAERGRCGHGADERRGLRQGHRDQRGGGPCGRPCGGPDQHGHCHAAAQQGPYDPLRGICAGHHQLHRLRLGQHRHGIRPEREQAQPGGDGHAAGDGLRPLPAAVRYLHLPDHHGQQGQDGGRRGHAAGAVRLSLPELERHDPGGAGGDGGLYHRLYPGDPQQPEPLLHGGAAEHGEQPERGPGHH